MLKRIPTEKLTGAVDNITNLTSVWTYFVANVRNFKFDQVIKLLKKTQKEREAHIDDFTEDEITFFEVQI